MILRRPKACWMPLGTGVARDGVRLRFKYPQHQFEKGMESGLCFKMYERKSELGWNSRSEEAVSQQKLYRTVSNVFFEIGWSNGYMSILYRTMHSRIL